VESVEAPRDGCIRWVEIVEEEGAVLAINVGHPVLTNGEFIA